MFQGGNDKVKGEGFLRNPLKNTDYQLKFRKFCPTRPEGAEALSPLAKLELFKFVRKVIMFVCVVIPNLCQ